MKGSFCRCTDNKADAHRNTHWRLLRSGWHNGKPSVHRYVVCLKCGSCWGTSANYTYSLNKITDQEREDWGAGRTTT
jgi:hypothetical protein